MVSALENEDRDDPKGLIDEEIGQWLKSHPFTVVIYKTFDEVNDLSPAGSVLARCYYDSERGTIAYFWEDRSVYYRWRHSSADDFFSDRVTFICEGICSNQRI